MPRDDTPLALLKPVEFLLVSVAAIAHADSLVSVAWNVFIVIRAVVAYEAIVKINKVKLTFHTCDNDDDV